jgi:hypothetical protein
MKFIKINGIDPLEYQDQRVSPDPVDILQILEGKLSWNENKFSLNQNKSWRDPHGGSLGGSLSWNIFGEVNKGSATIDSFFLDHEFHNLIYWGGHAPMGMSISKKINAVSIPFFQRTSDTLIFQGTKSLTYFFDGGDNSYGMPPPFSSEVITPNGSYIRIILHK